MLKSGKWFDSSKSIDREEVQQERCTTHTFPNEMGILTSYFSYRLTQTIQMAKRKPIYYCKYTGDWSSYGGK